MSLAVIDMLHRITNISHYYLINNNNKKSQQYNYTFTFHCNTEKELHCNPIKKNYYNRELKTQGDSIEKMVCTLFLKI